MERFFIALAILLAGFGCAKEEAGKTQDLGAITVQVPDTWKIEEPSSQMRKAQYALAGQAGEADASLVVFYFGPGQGGSVEANLERWYGQFKQPDGRSSSEAAATLEKIVDGMKVTQADVSRTYAPGAMGPFMPAADPQEKYRMLAAIVDSPEGFYYFKLTGPGKTVAHWQGSFDRFVDRIKRK